MITKKTRIDPGLLTKRMAFQKETDTVSATGGATKSWTTLATISASIDWLSSQEVVRAGQPIGTRMGMVRTRWFEEAAGVTPETKHSLLYEGRRLDIVSLIDVGDAHRACEMMVVERTTSEDA